MRRGTTPTVRTKVKADLHGLNIYLTFELAKNVLLTKTGNDLNVYYEIDEETGLVSKTVIETTLTQEETLQMKAGKSVSLQIRAERNNGDIAGASSIESFDVEKILLDGRIPQ